MAPSRFSMTLQGLAVSTLTVIAGATVWTKHCHFEPIDPQSDATFKSPFFTRYNPHGNASFHDVCVRRLPLVKIDYALVKDAEAGGSMLVERFAQGIYGGRAYILQRLYETLAHKDAKTAHQLWTKRQLCESKYEIGTEVTDHFNVVERPDPCTILLRCGDSPLNKSGEPRESDGLFEVVAKANFDEGFAEFRLKSVFYRGDGKGNRAPFEGEWLMPWAHKVYTRVLMESAVGNCKKGMFDGE